MERHQTQQQQVLRRILQQLLGQQQIAQLQQGRLQLLEAQPLVLQRVVRDNYEHP